jgi:hypothetical protein
MEAHAAHLTGTNSMMLAAAGAAADFSFESAMCGASASGLIAFAALRWTRRARDGRPGSPAATAVAVAETLASTFALVLIGLVLLVSLYALADHRSMPHSERLLSVRLLGISLLIFVAGVLLERLSEPAEQAPGPWDFLYSGWVTTVVAWTAAVTVSTFVALEVALGSSMKEELRASAIVIGTGLVTHVLVLGMGRWYDGRRRRTFLRRLERDRARPACLIGPSIGETVVRGWSLDARASPDFLMTTHEARRMAVAFERRRLDQERTRDLAVRFSPLSTKLTVHDERLKRKRYASKSSDLGLVTIDFDTWHQLLVLDRVPAPSPGLPRPRRASAASTAP